MAEESKFKLSKRDRLRVFWRSQFLQASWNFERMQNIGWAYAMIPALKKNVHIKRRPFISIEASP